MQTSNKIFVSGFKEPKFYVGQKVIVCNTLKTLITKIEDEKYYFLDEDANVKWDIESSLEPIIEPKTNLDKLPFPESVIEFAKFYEKVPLVEEPKQKCCQDVSGYYLGTICPKCNKPFRSVIQEPKQETLEQMINILPEKYAKNLDLFLKGMQYQKDQDKNKYSEEEAMELFIEGYKQRAELSRKFFDNNSRMFAIALFKKFKKK